MSIDDDIKELENSANIRFDAVIRICARYFAGPRVRGSHHIFKMPWPGDPRINLQQQKGGKVARYQVRQVIKALEKLKDGYGDG